MIVGSDGSPPYLNRSSNAFRASLGRGVVVSRSTVVRGEYSVHVLRSFFGDTRAVSVGSMHSKRLPGSKEAHCAQACRSAPHLPHRLSKPTSVSAITDPQCVQRTTSRNPGI